MRKGNHTSTNEKAEEENFEILFGKKMSPLDCSKGDIPIFHSKLIALK